MSEVSEEPSRGKAYREFVKKRAEEAAKKAKEKPKGKKLPQSRVSGRTSMGR